MPKSPTNKKNGKVSGQSKVKSRSARSGRVKLLKKKSRPSKKREIKNFNTMIRFTLDGVGWTPYMTASDFVKRSKGLEMAQVEIVQVMSKKQALSLLPHS